jgi:hypothetical protein
LFPEYLINPIPFALQSAISSTNRSKTGKEVLTMANCFNMKEGDLYECKNCGLELKVTKPCACTPGSGDACSVPLMCCGKEMTPKTR